MKYLSGFGKNTYIYSRYKKISKYDELIKTVKKEKILICKGNGRSYCNSSIQPKLTIKLKEFNKIINLNKNKNIIKVQSGLKLFELINYLKNKNYFIPVTPGTKFVTIGGMLASDIHGKSDHLTGSISNHVKEIKLLDGNGKIFTCSMKKNSNIFKATLGGMGCTGIIIEASIRVIKLKTYFIDEKKILCKSFNELLTNFEKYRKNQYLVAWCDFANFENFSNLKSILYIGNHSKLKGFDKFNFKIVLPIFIYKLFLNNFFIKILNKIIFIFAFLNNKSLKSIENFFYPLDKIKNWNKIYGKNGFYQYQFISDKKNFQKLLSEILLIFKKHNIIPYLSVIKTMSGLSRSLIPFNDKGVNIAMDIPNKKNTKKLLNLLDEKVIKYKGKIYLTKHHDIDKKKFEKMYKKTQVFRKIVNQKRFKKFRSIQTERLF